MNGKIVITTTPSRFRDYDTANLKVQYSAEVIRGSEAPDWRRIQTQNTHRLKQIENVAIHTRPAILRELLLAGQRNRHTVQVIGDSETATRSASPLSVRRKVQKTPQARAAEEAHALASANRLVASQVEAFNARLRQRALARFRGGRTRKGKTRKQTEASADGKRLEGMHLVEQVGASFE